MMKFLLIFIIFYSFLFAKEITLEFLQDKPKSRAKDFYIWRFLAQDITPEEADKAYAMANVASGKIVSRYIKKTKNKEFLEKQNCYALTSGEFLSKSNQCISLGISPIKASVMPKVELVKIAERIEKDYPKIAIVAKIFASEIPVQEMLNIGGETFLSIFLRMGDNFRRKHLDLSYSNEFLQTLSSEKKFESFVRTITLDNNMSNARNTLLNFDSKSANSTTNFLLAINAIDLKQDKLALNFLNFAYKSVKLREDKDKILFWQYLITKNTKYLSEILRDTFDVNIYSLYASEKLNQNLPNNIVSSIITNKEIQKKFDISDPFLWLQELQKYRNVKDIKIVTQEFDYLNTEPHLAFFLEKANNFRINYFIFPYEEIFKGLDGDRKAMLLALAKQESHFIPTSISSSYALGMMQIMPFLVEHIAKKLKKNIMLDDMFKPEIGVEFANFHLNNDLKTLSHPLFIAYAYNAGVGYTLRLIKSGAFNGTSEYEPFLSLEKIIYEETKSYGKKVLANYVVYKKLLGQNVQISTILNDIPISAKTYQKRR